jgi:hypothetical protein
VITAPKKKKYCNTYIVIQNLVPYFVVTFDIILAVIAPPSITTYALEVASVSPCYSTATPLPSHFIPPSLITELEIDLLH